MSPITEPLLLEPYLAKRPWGGSELGDGIGEAWDLSVHPSGPSMVVSGRHKGKTLADVVDSSPDSFGGPIQLLAKRLDCAQNLSIQVHPQNSDSKTEAWAVLANKPGAGVFHGVKNEVQQGELRKAAEDGSLPGLMKFQLVEAGQGIFVPAGTIHAIGGGLQLFELQQSSDTTYRLFDWGRDREMHLDQGLACSRFTPSEAISPKVSGSHRLIDCEFFYIDWCEPRSEMVINPGDKWAAVSLVKGELHFADFSLKPGQTALVPQAAGPQALTVGDGPQIALRYGPNN